MLGIVIGVGAVIVMIAVGAGAQARVEEQIRALGSNLLLVMPGSTTAGGARMGFGSGSTLTEDDVVAINREIPEALAAPALRGSAQVIWGNSNWSTQIYGVTPEYLDVRQWPLASGRPFEPRRWRVRQGPASSAPRAKQIFGTEIRSNRCQHQERAVPSGRAGDQGPEPHGKDQNDLILMPIHHSARRVLGFGTPPSRASVGTSGSSRRARASDPWRKGARAARQPTTAGPAPTTISRFATRRGHGAQEASSSVRRCSS